MAAFSTGSNVQTFTDRDLVLELDKTLQGWTPVKDEDKSDWDKVFAKRIIGALQEHFYTPLKIVGWIADISQPLAVKPRNVSGAKVTRGFQITIVDDESEHLKTLIIPLNETTKTYYELKKTNKRVVFCGAIVPISAARSQESRFFLWDIIPSWNAEDLIGIDPSAANNQLVRTFERVQKKPHGIFNYIKDKTVENIGIRGLGSMPELDRSVEVMILQALSDGMNARPRFSNRIHTLIMSTPGQGKKFLHDTAAALNPSYAQASTVGGKVNAAGLIGNVIGRGKKTISAPGLLPLNSGGVVSFQDIHQLKVNRSVVLAALSEVMEDGRVTDSNSPRITHEAVTAIHVDMNRSSDVGEGHKDNPYRDINIPYNIISRFDYIVQLPAGQNGYNPIGANNPVTSVNWYDILKWCNARSEKDGFTPVYCTNNTLATVYQTSQLDLAVDAVKWTANGYRLPTEAEWEFAARGGTSSKGYIYSGSNSIDSVAWYYTPSPHTQSVGTKFPNNLGLYDMSGNVWEWCSDWYGAYSASAQTDPKGSTSGTYRVQRGGSIWYGADECRVASRSLRSVPSGRFSSGGGFRCVRDVE